MSISNSRKATCFLNVLLSFLLALITIFTSSSSCYAFTCHSGKIGAINVEISKIDALTVEGKVYYFPINIENSSDSTVSIKARFSSIESVYLYDREGNEIAPGDVLEENYEVEGNSKLESQISFAVRGAFTDAHYPIRSVFLLESEGKTESLDLRPVFATKLTERLERSEPLKILELSKRSFLKLSDAYSTEYAPYWKNDGGETHFLPIGWSGQDDDSKAIFNFCEMVRGGVRRSSWSTHPPYAHGPGVSGVRFAIKLPESEQVNLRFYRAMRTVVAPEPPTDGTCARVYAAPFTQETLKDVLYSTPNSNDLLFEEEYNGVEWDKCEVDLSRYAGRSIVLTFEIDPGAKRDTTCDQCFWGDVALLADPQNATLTSDSERENLRSENETLFKEFSLLTDSIVSSGVELSERSRGFDLGDGQRAVVTLGKFGVCDGWVALGSAEKYVQVDGVRVRYQGTNIGFESPLKPCNVFTRFVEANDLEREARRFARMHNEEIVGDIPVDAVLDPSEEQEKLETTDENEICCFISKTLAGLAFRFVASNNAQIETLQFGPFSQNASRVYYGHGNVIVNPEAFIQDGDGFGCASSHVGFDFENGVSVLEATTRPVLNFVVDPEKKIYSLSTSSDSRLTLLSGDKGAMACAIKYAPGFDKAAAPLVAKKAGRFVFDYWGGSFARVLERMKRYVKYGLTDSLLIQHVWQHYGYDVRLPDIWPPSAGQGTIDELKATQNFCDAYGIPFGLHDNYIDFYPDADGFTYDDIIIDPDGQPQKAWYNPGPDVQSYRFNPNRIFPFVERNLDLISKDLMQTAYFTDVFSSIHIMDFYDRNGVFHSRSETLAAWNKYFDLVREKFNGNAITISESGNDALIGHLDGADAILRRITSEQENYSTVIKCDDSEYLPWFDAVNHNRFSLHGVGYSERYQGGMSRALRGVNSDDYISSEVITGHAVMNDLPSSDRDTIRKYWLMQEFARSIALDVIEDFQFVDSDLHHQRILWKSGVVVFVNRGVGDWKLNDVKLPNSEKSVVLPRFGFWTIDKTGKVCGGIIHQNDQIVEIRVNGENFYVNGRQKIADQATPIRPSLEDVEVVDNKTLSAKFIWEALASTEKPYAPFLHLEPPQTWWNDKPELTVLYLPAPAKTSDSWQGREDKLFGEKITISIPENIQPGFYNILTGLYDTKSGGRLSLLGFGTRDTRYRIGGIEVEGRGAERSIKFKPVEPLFDVDLRLAPNKNATDFALCETKGAFRAVFHESEFGNYASLTPLPDEPRFDVLLKTPFFGDGEFEIVARDDEGNVLNTTLKKATEGTLTLTLDASEAFSYDVVKK